MIINNEIKRFTIKIVNYLNMTSAEKQSKRLEKRKQKNHREFYSGKWLGTIPFMCRMLFKNK